MPAPILAGDSAETHADAFAGNPDPDADANADPDADAGADSRRHGSGQ